MVETPQQFINLIYLILVVQGIVLIILAWIVIKAMLKRKKEQPTEKEIRKVLEKEEQEKL